MQSELRSKIKELVRNKERIDIVCLMEIKVGLEEEQVIRWCQGQVKGEVMGTELPTVKVKWDRMADVVGWEKGGTTEQVPKDHLYNREKVGAYQLDANDFEPVRELDGDLVGGGKDNVQSDVVESEDEAVSE